MSKTTVNPIEEGFNTLTPHLICRDATAAMDFYKRAFGAVEVMRLAGPDGKLMHGSMKIGDSMLMLAEESPNWKSFGPQTFNGSPVTIHLAVADVDAAMARAAKEGANVTMPAADMFWGDRYGKLLDPFGHIWSVATHIRDMSHDEIAKAGMEMMKNMSANCPDAGATTAK